jgi:hypothetical protein
MRQEKEEVEGQRPRLTTECQVSPTGSRGDQQSHLSCHTINNEMAEGIPPTRHATLSPMINNHNEIPINFPATICNLTPISPRVVELQQPRRGRKEQRREEEEKVEGQRPIPNREEKRIRSCLTDTGAIDSDYYTSASHVD